MRNKKLDFKHKVAAFYTSEYDAVFVEHLNLKGMLEGERDGRNTAEVGWREFITILKHHGRKRGWHVVDVNPGDATKTCHECGVKTRNRCGFGSTHVRRVGLKPTVIITLHSVSGTEGCGN